MAHSFWKFTGIAAVVAATTAAAVYMLHYKRQSTMDMPSRFVGDIDHNDKPQQTIGDNETLTAEISAKIESFAGCFEPLYRASERGTAESVRLILKDISDRIRHFNGCDNLKRWMTDLTTDADSRDDQQARSKAGLLMALFTQAGLEKDEHTSVTVDADTCTCYYHDELDDMPIGLTCRVKSPCWTFNGKVLEKGILA